MDKIFLHGLKADTLIGVYEWERRAPQTIELDLDIGIPSEQPCHSDDIGDTIHYGVVVERVRALLAADAPRWKEMVQVSGATIE